MLDALYFLLAKTSQALGILLALDIPLSDGYSIDFYWILVLLFIIYIFIRVLQRYLGKSSNYN